MEVAPDPTPAPRCPAVARTVGMGRPGPSVVRGSDYQPRPRTHLPPEEFVYEVPAPPAAIAAAAATPPVARAAPSRRPFRPIDIWKRYLPPVRLVWLFLGILVAVGGGFISSARAGPLLVVPVIGAFTDLFFQRVRFPRLRFPDAALATSLFLSIIIWPSDVSLALVSVAIASVGLRHFIRAGGHPWLNPAAAGLVLATVLFALPTSWHVGLTSDALVVIVLLGIVLMIRAPHAWRIPVFYFAAYFVSLIALTFALGAGAHWAQAFVLEGLSGASLFFGFFMVTEPRTAPSARGAMAFYGGLLGVVSAGLPVLFTEVPVLNALGVIAPFLALFLGNFVTLVLPSARGTQRRTSAPAGATVG